MPLNYVKGCAGGAAGRQWYPWTDLSTASQVTLPTFPAHPSPIFSDIEFSDDGDMILGFTDRTGFQYGSASPLPNGLPTDTTVVTVFAGGDMLRADFDRRALGRWNPAASSAASAAPGSVTTRAPAAAISMQRPPSVSTSSYPKAALRCCEAPIASSARPWIRWSSIPAACCGCMSWERRREPPSGGHPLRHHHAVGLSQGSRCR